MASAWDILKEEKAKREEVAERAETIYRMSVPDYASAKGYDALRENGMGYTIVMNQNALVNRKDSAAVGPEHHKKYGEHEKTLDISPSACTINEERQHFQEGKAVGGGALKGADFSEAISSTAQPALTKAHWPAGFPKVVVHTNQQKLRHEDKEFHTRAKNGRSDSSKAQRRHRCFASKRRYCLRCRIADR